MNIEKIINEALFNVALDGRRYGRLDITKAFLSLASVMDKSKKIVEKQLEENGVKSEKQLLEIVGLDKLDMDNKYSSILQDIIEYYANLLIAKIDKRIDSLGNKAIYSRREYKVLIFNI